MKKIYFALAMMAMTSVPAMAQEGETTYPTIETGYFRIVHNGYGDVLNVDKKYGFSLNATENDARTMPGSIFYYDTDGMYMFGDDMEQLDPTSPDFVAQLQDLMGRTAWKSGSYTTYDFTNQGISYVGGYLSKLAKYVNDAFDNFSESDAVKEWYENPDYILARVYLGATLTQFFYPESLTSLETFRGAVKNFMTVWKSYLDLNIYLSPVPNVENGFNLMFHSPTDNVGGIRIQKTMDELSEYHIDDQVLDLSFDFFGAVKRQVIEEAAKELDGEALAYIEHVLEPIELDKQYYICENEQGELYVAGFNSLSGTFGEEGAFDDINPEEIVWIMQPVDDVNPLMVEMDEQLIDVDANYYTTMFTEFPYELKDGVEAYYIDAVNEGVAHLTQIEGKVPAMTGVILRSKSAAAVSNVVIPVDEEVAAIEGNLLKGTCLPMEAENVSVMKRAAEGETANIVMGKANAVEANQCYIDTPEDGSNVIIAAAGEAPADPTAIQAATIARQASPIYDLQGRRVMNPTKGLYIQNGKKAIVK